MSAAFEADLCPETGAPRVRFNFPNGWSASLVLRSSTKDRCHFLMASLAACPTGEWGSGKTEIIGNEMDACDVADHLCLIGVRRKP